MIFLFDANVPKRLQTSVNKIFTKHKFFATWDPPFNPSMDDLSLFHTAHETGIEALITLDTVQMTGADRQHERRACRDARLHWLGIAQPFRARGALARQAATAGQLITNLPYALDVFDKATQPTAILLRPAPLRLHSEKGFPQAI